MPPNTRIIDGSQSLGDINLVTAIGFELVRRNVRMIVDRSPESERLIPAEKTQIRLEMASKKVKAEIRNEKVLNSGYPGDTELTSKLDQQLMVIAVPDGDDHRSEIFSDLKWDEVETGKISNARTTCRPPTMRLKIAHRPENADPISDKPIISISEKTVTSQGEPVEVQG